VHLNGCLVLEVLHMYDQRSLLLMSVKTRRVIECQKEGAGSVLGKAKKVIGGGGIQAYGVAVRGRKIMVYIWLSVRV
jgi:hypothetical protein